MSGLIGSDPATMAHRINLYTVFYADYDLFHDGFVVRIGLVVPRPEILPRSSFGIPADFNDAIVKLLS